MTATSTATVKTLTAEVRVLMVGNRQVTISVFRQLETVPLSEMDPFGRVSGYVTNGKAHGTYDFKDYVVGRCLKTGALVRAAYGPNEFPRKPFVFRLTGRVTACPYARRSGEGGVWINMHGLAVEFGPGLVEFNCPESHGLQKDCGHWDFNGLDDEVLTAIRRWDATFRCHQKAANLPLIVLAGLR